MTEYNRVYNFSAGPSMLPLPVLEKVKEDLLNYQGSGQSVMEMSHRSASFKKIIEEAEDDLREIMEIPDNYKVLFLQGGGTIRFVLMLITYILQLIIPYMERHIIIFLRLEISRLLLICLLIYFLNLLM